MYIYIYIYIHSHAQTYIYIYAKNFQTIWEPNKELMKKMIDVAYLIFPPANPKKKNFE